MIDHDWLEEEGEGPGVWRELKRLFRRARRRWARTLLFALAATCAIVVYAAKKPRSYESRIVFRITEGDIDAATAPKTNGRLRDYVAQVVFSNGKLLEIIKARGLYPSLMKRDPTLALESMRDDIDVDVWRNYFALPHTPEDPARTARLAVTFHGRDKHVVYDTVRDLGQLILDHEQRSRVQQAEIALRVADDEADAARRLLSQRKRELVEKQLAAEHPRTTDEGLALMVEVRGLEKAVPRADLLVQKAEKARERAWLRVQLEKRALGLRIELVDPGRIAREGLKRSIFLGLLGSVVLAFALALAAVGVGAWDDKVYDAEDVRRLGLPLVGSVRGFDGDNAGALAERLHAGPHARLGGDP